LKLGYLSLISAALLRAACPECPQPGFGGPAENRFTVYDALCRGAACRDSGFPQIFVNTANLALFARVTDLAFGSAPALTLEHSFNMDDTRSGVLGTGWSFSLGDTLLPDADGSLLLRRGSGRVDRFAAAPGGGAFFAVTNTRDTLTQSASGTYSLRNSSSNVTWNFRADGKLAGIQDGAAPRVSLDYDAGGRIATARYRGRTIQFSTDDRGRIVQIADPAGRTVSFTYSAEDRLVGQTNADGSNVTYEYDATGNLTNLTYSGGKYGFAYSGDSPNGRVATVTMPDGAVRTYDLSPAPRETRVTDGNGDAWLYVSTAQGLVQSVRDPAGNTAAYAYDSAGNLSAVTNPAGETLAFTYDASGNLTAVADPAGNRWTADYSSGLLTRITDPRRSIWTFRYDAAGNLTGVTDPLAGATSATRTAAGQVASLSDPAGNQSAWQYDADGLPAGFTDPLGGKWSYGYDGAARAESRTDPGGTTLRADRDVRNRVSALRSGDAVATFDYGRLQRDSLGRLTSYTDSFGNGITYKYDAAGQLTSLTMPGGKTVTYQYDRLRRLAAVSDWAGNMALYRYDAAGYPLSLSIAGGPVTIWQYDTARNLRAIVSTGPDGAPVAGYRYTVDAAGNRTGVSALESIASARGRAGYTLTYDTANRPIGRSDGQNYSYDARGNLSAISGSSTASFGYDPFGRLTSAGAGDTATSYGYDFTGLRASRNDRRYLWDPAGAQPRVVMEADSSNAPIAWYVYGLGLLWKLAADGTSYFHHFDGDGNVVAVSNSTGVVNQYRYDGAGNLVASNEAVENLFHAGGAAGWIDDGNGLLFAGSEFRMPELRLTLPASADPSPPLQDLRPRLRGPGACFFDGVASCALAGRER
jgi:YD repeat-containing protein